MSSMMLAMADYVPGGSSSTKIIHEIEIGFYGSRRSWLEK